jgi:hypothetical protein
VFTRAEHVIVQLTVCNHAIIPQHEQTMSIITAIICGYPPWLPTLGGMTLHTPPVHQLQQTVSADSPFGEAICCHVTSVEPDQLTQHPTVQLFPNVLNMTQQRLFCWNLDERGGNRRKDRHRIHKQNQRNLRSACEPGLSRGCGRFHTFQQLIELLA